MPYTMYYIPHVIQSIPVTINPIRILVLVRLVGSPSIHPYIHQYLIRTRLYMCMCICIYMYLLIYLSICLCIYQFICLFSYVYICNIIYIYMCTYVFLYLTLAVPLLLQVECQAPLPVRSSCFCFLRPCKPKIPALLLQLHLRLLRRVVELLSQAETTWIPSVHEIMAQNI